MRRRAEQRRSISLTGAGVNRMRRMAEAEKCYNEIGLLLKIAPPSRLHEIPNKQFDRKFVDCWVAAGSICNAKSRENYPGFVLNFMRRL